MEAEARAAKKTTESFENCIVVVGYFLILGYQIRLRYLEIRDAGRVDVINAVLKSEDKRKSIPKVPEIPRRSDLGWFKERKCLRETKRVFKELKSLW